VNKLGRRCFGYVAMYLDAKSAAVDILALFITCIKSSALISYCN